MSDFLGVIIVYAPTNSSRASSGFTVVSSPMNIVIGGLEMTDSAAPFNFMQNTRTVNISNESIQIYNNFQVKDNVYIGADPSYNVPIAIYGVRI